MTNIIQSKFVRSGVPKGTKVVTERGGIAVEDLLTMNYVLTEDRKFIPIIKIEKVTASGYYLVSAHGLDPIPLTSQSQVCVRDIVLKTEGDETFPLISWPYWVSIQDIDLSKHMILSPYNPHLTNPYRALRSKINPPPTASAYTDKEQQVWIQVEKIEYVEEEIETFCIGLEYDNAIAVEYLSVK